MRVQLWHLVVLAIPVVLAVLLYLVVRGGVRHGMRDASRHTSEDRL